MQQLGSKGTIYIAAGVTALGFLVIFLGWNGAAGKDFVSGQVPYLISGGLAGLGLVFVGLTMANAEARRRDTARLTAKLDRLLEHLGAAPDSDDLGVAEQVSEVQARRASRRRASA
ncbi:MAG TPA: hypothetical protein VM618_01475 [Acidimicrobiia bacterium]|nr:hypothetical protein [Acidimicrobiia bacterium]